MTEILKRAPNAVALLLGQNGPDFFQQLVRDHPQLATRMHAPGLLSADALAQHVTVCTLLVQPYADGITSRRTSAMAGFAMGVPVVSTIGDLTESFWTESGGVSLVPFNEPHAMVSEVLRLLSDDNARRRLAARGRDLYIRQFDVRHSIGALRRAALEACASLS